MNSRDRQRIVGTLIDISRNMISSAGKTKYRNLKVVGSKLVVDQHADKFDAVVADLLKKHRWSEKYSEQHLSTALGELVHSIGQTGPELTKEEFDRFVRDFQRYSDKQVVYVPIQNIILQQKTLKFGGVTFKKMTGYQIKKLSSGASTIIRTTPYTAQEQKAFIRHMRHDLDELRGKVCAEYSVVAEPIRAMERAEIETKRALDVLRYSTSWLYNNNRQVAIIGLESDIVPQSRTAFTLSLSTRTYRISHRHVGPLFTLEISKQSTKEMKRKGIFKVARILEKPTDGVTDFEDTLLRGIHSCRSLKFVGINLEC